jgi:ribosomal-protein-alanine N-acetyltransferase
MSAEVFEIRALHASDLDAIDAVERRSYVVPWSRSMFSSELAKSGSITLGALSDGELLGYLVTARHAAVWHIMNVAVEPSHRGRGIAKALFARMFELTRHEVGCAYTLEVRVSNTAAITLYTALGFASHGLRPGYYTDNGEDALIMWLERS